MHIKITDTGTYPKPVKRLITLWRGLNKIPSHPKQSDFTAKNLKPWLDYIDIYDVEKKGVDFRIRTSGGRVLQETHEDWWGRTARDIDIKYNANLHKDMLAAFKGRQPSIHHIRLFQSDDKTAYRILLPVYDNGKTEEITQIFLCLIPD